MIPLDSGTGTFVEIMVLVGENRMRCQSVKVKVSNSLWHFIRDGWLLTVSLKGGLFSWKYRRENLLKD